MKVNNGKVIEIARATVVPKLFWAVKYAVSPTTCPKMKLRINNPHKSHGIMKIRFSLFISNAMRTNVIVPTPVRNKLIKVGLASCSVLRKMTLDPTNVSTARIAISSPYIF